METNAAKRSAWAMCDTLWTDEVSFLRELVRRRCGQLWGRNTGR